MQISFMMGSEYNVCGIFVDYAFIAVHAIQLTFPDNSRGSFMIDYGITDCLEKSGLFP